MTWWRKTKYKKQFKNGLWVTSKFSHVATEHETGHTTSTFQNYSSENKLLQELGDEMFIIISNNVQSKINPFIRFMWEDQYQLEFVATVV